MTAKPSPERKCISSGDVKPQSELVRFVVDPQGTLCPDLAGKLPGRGIWISANRANLERAQSKGLFARAAKCQLAVPPDLSGLVERLLVARAIEGLSLARRSGAVIAGFTKVEAMLRQMPPLALLEASDGAQDGRRKLIGLAKAWQKRADGEIPVVACLDSSELGLAFGRGSVIHAALERSGMGVRVMQDLRRLGGFRDWQPQSWAVAESAVSENRINVQPR
jgi:predicted RNA-binding protein YlxR (DUF448 family)